MIEKGIVARTDGDKAYVVFKRSSACGNCKACGMLKDMSELTVDMKNSLGAKPNDAVVVEFSAANSLKSSVVAYVFPLLMLIIGVVLGYYIYSRVSLGMDKDAFAAIMGVAFTAAAYLMIKLCEPVLKKKLANNFKMVAVDRAEKEEDVKDEHSDSQQ